MSRFGPAPRLTVLAIDLFERDVRFRLPFRFGVVTLGAAPQAFVRARIRLDDGRESEGVAAELMVPKWFDKSGALSNEDNFDQLRLALSLARDGYLGSDALSAFGLAAANSAAHLARCQGHALNPLVAGFGPALIDRAVLDALCRAVSLSFYAALRANLPGIETQALAPDLAGFDIAGHLASLQPRQRLHARHTVGMVDPLIGADQPPGTRLQDGLPETLEEVVRVYGHRYFKLKVRGDLPADLERLAAIAGVLDAMGYDYHTTLDGNEQYQDVAGVVELLRRMEEIPTLRRLRQSILFVEQPIHRDRALASDVAPLARLLPVIIDESDAELDAFPRARARGYAGVSSKSCKGFYKSLLNSARCAAWNAAQGETRYFLSGEDLTCQSGIAVQQDLVLVSVLGIAHVERNGHHYVWGMAGAPAAEQRRLHDAHPGLYQERGARVCLRIEAGMLDIAALDCPGYGTSVLPDWQVMRPMAAPSSA